MTHLSKLILVELLEGFKKYDEVEEKEEEEVIGRFDEAAAAFEGSNKESRPSMSSLVSKDGFSGTSSSLLLLLLLLLLLFCGDMFDSFVLATADKVAELAPDPATFDSDDDDDDDAVDEDNNSFQSFPYME